MTGFWDRAATHTREGVAADADPKMGRKRLAIDAGGVRGPLPPRLARARGGGGARESSARRVGTEEEET